MLFISIIQSENSNTKCKPYTTSTTVHLDKISSDDGQFRLRSR